ncbi:MAG: F0F1 ATP synthase subunit delta [Deltaproteobacteria bacterium]|nr:F0F1 ATP synthase subunit delta [Deltaproteobacteria bacterium]
MLIDWFTVIAQIVNFLILVFLLKHFLYDRIIQVMDQREQKIQSRMKDAKDKEIEAEKEAASYREKKESIERERQDMLTKTREEAETQRKEMTRKARDEVQGLRKQWTDSIEREKDTFLSDLRRLTIQQVYSVSRKTMKDLADAELEERVAEVFLSRIRDLPEDRRKALNEAMNHKKTAVVKSAFELPTALRQKTTKTLHHEIGDGVDVSYQTDPDMIMGIELKAGGQKIAWTVADYLESLENEAKEALEKETEKGETG